MGLVLFVVLLMMATISYFNFRQDFAARQQEINERMLQIAKAIASVGTLDESQNWDTYQEYIDNIYLALDNIVYIAIFDREGNLPAYVLNEDLVEIPSSVAVTDSVIKAAVVDLDERRINPISDQDLGNVSSTIRILDENIGQVRLGYSKINLNNELQRIRNRNYIMLAIFLFIGLLASLFLSGKLTKPLMRLSTAMETVPHGSQDMIVEIKSHDEIGSLAQSFNYMVRTLREREFFDRFERDLSNVFTLEKIFSVLLGRLQYLYHINKGTLIIRHMEDDRYFNFFQQNASFNFDSQFHSELKHCLVNHLKKDEICFSLEGLRIIANETPALRPFIPILEENRIHWVVFLQRKKTNIGLMYLGKDKGDFSVDIEEKKYIVNLVHHTLLPIENALLYADLTEKERLKKELEIAHTVQMNLLPNIKPVIPGFDIFGMCIPATEVGGDYFDFVEIDKNHIGIVIADVSGKGTSASFYMAEIKGMIISLSALYHSPKELLKILNNRLYLNSERQVFATMIYGILNTKNGEFVFSRAGHNPVFVKKSGRNSVDIKVPNGIGLGLDDGNIFNNIIVEDKGKLRCGDASLLYTDGVTEAMNSLRDEFGEDRLQQILVNYNGSSAEQECNNILQQIKHFTGGFEQNDDMSMIVIRSCE